MGDADATHLLDSVIKLIPKPALGRKWKRKPLTGGTSALPARRRALEPEVEVMEVEPISTSTSGRGLASEGFDFISDRSFSVLISRTGGNEVAACHHFNVALIG